MVEDNNKDLSLNQLSSTQNPVAKSYTPNDILNLGYDEDYVLGLDEKYSDMLGAVAAKVNNYTGSRRSTNSKLAVPQSPEVKKNEPSVSDWISGVAEDPTYKPKQAYIEDTENFSIRETNFDRYYNHPKFAELGFHPYRDNEKYYNENSTFGDDWSRMSGQFMNNMLPAFSPFGIFDFNSDPDTDGAMKMADAMRIGTSSKEGFGSSFTNFSLNSAYTVGIISTIAVEELALWGATAGLAALTPATGGASGAAAAATAALAAERLAVNAKKLSNVSKWANRFADATQLGRGIKASGNLLSSLKNADKAKDFWNSIKTGESTLGRIFLPETMQALRTFETTKDVGNGIYKIGRRAEAFGGFYRDVRSVNLALDESRLEAGFAYNELVSKGVYEARQKSGNTNLTEEELKAVNENAMKGAHKSIMANVPVLYLSNRIVLGSALSGINPALKRVFSDELGNINSKILQTTKKVVDKTGKATQDVFEKKLSVYTPKGIAQRVKSYTIGGSAAKGAHGALRFFAANLGEGFQELYQEAVSHGIVEYYTEIFKDPAQDSKLLLDSVFESSVASQMNAQGFETFMSGFAMGGPMSVFSKAIFQGGPNLFNRTFNSKQFKAAKDRRDKAIDDLVNIKNQTWNDAANLQSVFDKRTSNFVKIRQSAAQQNKSAYEFDVFGFQDNKDFVEFQHLHHLISNGSVAPLKEQYQAFLNLSDEALVEAFPEHAADVKNGKLRKRFQNFLTKADVIEEEYNNLNDKLVNPANPSAYPPDSREYFNELAKERAYEHAKYLRMFTSQMFKDQTKRMANIYEELASDDLIYTQNGEGVKVSKMNASDFRILLDSETLRQELGILEQEIKVLKETKSDEKSLKNKTARFDTLKNYYKVITAGENQTKTESVKTLKNLQAELVEAENQKDEAKIAELKKKIKKERTTAENTRFDLRKISKLETAFKAYVEHLANENNAFYSKDVDKIKNTLKKIVDHGELSYRAKMYDKAVEVLTNPEVLDEIQERTTSYFKNKFIEDRLNLKENIKRAADKQLIADVLSELDKLGIVPNPDEVESFIATGDINVLQSFISEEGVLNAMVDSEKFMEVNRIFNIYRKATTPEAEVVEDENLEDNFDPEDAADQGITVNIINNDSNKNPYAKKILAKKYKEYVANKLKAGETPLSDVEYFKTNEALTIADAFNKLKALWMTDLNPDLKEFDSIVESDKGFGTWIQNNQDNPDVRDIINNANLSFEFLSPQPQTVNVLGPNVTQVDEKNNIRLVKTKTNNGDSYNITDLNNQPLPDSDYKMAGLENQGRYSTLSDAKKVFNKLVKAVPDTNTFEFAGIKMQYGDIVTDKAGNRYVVIGTPEKVERGGKLFILPFEDIAKYETTSQKEKAADRLTPVEFNSQYKLENVTFRAVQINDNTSRLIAQNIIGLFPMGVKRETGKQMIDVILKNLTPDQLKELSITVVKNEVTPFDNPRFFKADGKLENKLIEIKPETHAFTLSISDPIVASEINKILSDLGLDALENFDILIPSGNLEFADNNGDAFTFSNAESEKYFAFKNQALRALATQQIIRERLLEKLGNANEVVVKLTDVVDTISVDYNMAELEEGVVNSLLDLEHSTYDGEVVIIDNFTRYNAITGERDRALNYITNYEPKSDKAKNLRNKLEGELKEAKQLNGKNLIDYLKTERSFDRYHAVVKLPNGKIIFAPLKSATISAETQKDIYKKLLKQAAKTRENNLTEEGVVKDKTFNDKFNDELGSEFFISLKGGFKGQLRVTPNGGIAIRYLNIETDKLLTTTFFADKNTQDQFKSFGDLVKALDIMTNNENSPSTNGLGFKLTIDSFKRSFPEKTLADEVVKNTRTNLNPKLIDNLQLKFGFENNVINDYIASRKIANGIDKNLDNQSSDKFKDLIKKSISAKELDAIVDQIDRDGAMTPELLDTISLKRESFQNATTTPDATTTSDNEVVESLEEELKEAKAQLTVYLKALQAEVDSGEMTQIEYIKATAMNQDAEHAKLKGNVEQLERALNSAYGFKVVSDDFTQNDVEAIDNFINWAKKNLPDFIKIGDIEDVAKRLKVKGVPVGLFAMHLNNIAGGVDVAGTMYVGKKGFRYHEAFHAVFRLLLSDTEIKKYLRIAKSEVVAKLKSEGTTLRIEVEKFRNTAEKYKSMSNEKLEQEYLEEYLADEFEKFKTDPRSTKTDTGIKSIFNRILTWIKNVFNRYTRNELRTLFEKIDSGKYRSAGSMNNMFTKSFKTGVTMDAYKLLPYAKIKLDRGYANKYIDPNTTDLLIKQMTTSYLERVRKMQVGQSRLDILTETILDFQQYHDPFSEANASRSGEEIDKLVNRFKALGGILDENNSEEVAHSGEFMQKTADAVLEYISLFDQKIQNEKYLSEVAEENEGLRNVADWDKDQSMIGGFSNIPTALRAYIGTTTLLSSENEFGDTLPSGKRLYVPVDFTTVYNGALKAVKNITDPVEFLQALASFAEGNVQTESFVEKLFNDIGVTKETVLNKSYNSIINSISNPSLFQEVFKGFENFKVEYLFAHTNTNKDAIETNSKVLLYDAANRDDASSQIDVWKQTYSIKYDKIKNNSTLINKATDSLNDLAALLENPGIKMTNKKVNKKARKHSDAIYNNLGIRLSPAFIAFSIISNLTNTSDSKYQQSILNNNKQATPISSEALVEMSNQIKVSGSSNRLAGYLFSKKGTGVRSRLQKLAAGNALFDETIGQTVFLNPEGNFVYAHQMGTLHLKKIYGLNDASVLEDLRKEDGEYNATNILLNSPAFLAMSEKEQLKVLRVAGIKQSKLNQTNEAELEENAGIALDKNGKTYGDLTKAEFTALNINAYLTYYQQLAQKNKNQIEFVDPETGDVVETALAPVLIRVLEASNTGDLIPLPVIKTVELDNAGKVKLTAKALDLFTEEINREFKRIQRETATPEDLRTPIDGYNAKDGVLTSNEGRAFEFVESGYLLTPNEVSKNKLDAKDPRLADAVTERVLNGKQKTVYVSKLAATTIGITRQNTESRYPVTIRNKKTSKQFPLKSLGEIKVTENNIKAVIESMGEAVQKNKSKNFTLEVKVGDASFWVENKVTRNFLNGDVSLYGYDLSGEIKAQPTQQASGVEKQIFANSTLFEAIPNITETQIKNIYDNYVSLISKARKNKEISYSVFKSLIKTYQVIKNGDTYIFGNYDMENAVFISRLNSSPSSKELLANVLPNLKKQGLDVISFVPKDIADKYQRSGYSVSKEGFDYNFKGEDMIKYLATTNPDKVNQIFGKDISQLTSDEIEAYNKQKDLKYTALEIKGELIEKAGKDLSKILETYLNQFGIAVKDINEIKDKLSIDELGFADILSKIAYIKDKKDLPLVAGEFIAYMMQYNPLVSDIIKELSQTKNYKNLDKSEYFKIIGGLIVDDLQNKLDKNYSKSLIDKLKQLIKDFFSLLNNTPIEIINKNVGVISNNILQQNKKLVTASLYKPGAFGKPTKQISLEEAMTSDKFGGSIIKILSEKGFILTGSTSLGEQGTIQRPDENLLHDIDWVSPFSREETEVKFKESYPDAIKIRDIYGGEYVTDTWIIAPKNYKIINLVKESDYNIVTSYDIVDLKGDIVGTYRLQKQNNNNQKEEVVTGVEAKVIDFFSYEEFNQLTPFEKNNVQLSNWKEIFKAKLNFARYKDIWDYNRFIPNENVSLITSQQEQEAAQYEEKLDFDFKTILETIAKENPEISLEQALKDERIKLSMSEFKSILESRLIDDYTNFALDLESGRVQSKISSDILDGFKNDVGLEQGGAAMAELNLIRNNQDYNLMQIYFNNWLNTKAINQLIYGDQAKSLKDGIDKVKRAKLSNASYISAGSKFFDKSKGVNHETKDILGILYTDPEFNRVYAGGKGERSDAQMYISTKALKHMLFGFGRLDEAKSNLLKKLEKGEPIDASEFHGYLNKDGKKVEGYKDLNAIFNSLKLVYADGKVSLKMSAVVLTKELTSRETGKDENGQPIYEGKEQTKLLHNLRLKLEKLEQDNPKAIAIAYPKSAAKMMKANVAKHEDVFGDDVNAEIIPNLLDANYMGLQMENPSNKKEITDPTQLKALITTEQNDNEEVIIGGVTMTIGKVKEIYNNSLKTRLNNKYFNKVNLIANFSIENAMRELKTSVKSGELTIALDDFLDFATTSLKASGAASNTIEFFNKNLNYDLNNPLVQRQFEQLFLSYFAKGTISEKIPGDALALMSEHGYRVVRRVFSVDENGVPDKFSVIRDVTYNRNPLPIELRSDEEGNFEGLAGLIEASNGEGVIVSDILRHNVKEYDENGKYTGVRYTEGVRAANSIEASQIEEESLSMDDLISKAFVVRIPSQDKHSASSVKFIDFLPVYYGSTAMFSKELIEISGADFDIDKVYTHTKEFYKDPVTGKLIEYGNLKRSGKKEGFKDYAHYINEKLKSKKSNYYKAYEKYNVTTKNNSQKYTNAELAKAKENGFSKESFQALKLLGLPTTFDNYAEYVKSKGEPYDAALNNQILDQKFALWGNESNTVKARKEGQNPISYDPADLKALTEVWDYIKKELPDLAKEVDGNMGDVDSINGQARAYANNKEGAASIGKIVLPNLFLNFLGEHNIKLRSKKIAGKETIPQIEFNGITFSEFNADYEKIKKDGKISRGQRTQYIISALITAMTDNAKERLAAKLGLNKDALSVVGTLTKLGVPIKTSILLVSNPLIKAEYFAANNKLNSTDPGIFPRIKNVLREIGEKSTVEVTDAMLEKHIKNGIDLDNATPKEIVEIYSILKQFQTAHRVKSYINELSAVMNLNKGFGQNFTDVNRTTQSLKQLGLEMSNDQFSKANFKNLPLPIDVRPLFKSDLWHSNITDVFKHFRDVLLPQVFLTRTPAFVEMESAVLKNIVQDEYLIDEDTKSKISNDLLSFLTIKAYMKDLESKGASIPLASLSNEMLYPQANSKLNIHSLIDGLKKENPNNEFLNVFIYNENANDLDNATGIHNAQSNTFGKRTDIDKIKVQAAFMEIFGKNKVDAMHIIHYMMVKDGFQYGSGSLLEAVTPAVLDNFATSTENIFDIMKSERYGEIFEKKFGNTYDGLLDEFLRGYLKSNKNNIFLDRVISAPFYSALYRNTLLADERITKDKVLNDESNLYIFAENQNKVGTVNESAIRGLQNARPLTLMYDLSTFYDVNDLTDFANRLDFEINEIVESGKKVVFPKFLLSKDKMEKLKTTSPEIFDYLDQKLRAEFGYILQEDGSGYVALEEGSVKRLESISDKAVYIEKNEKETILNVNVAKDLTGMQLRNTPFELKTEKIKGKKIKTVRLPIIIKNLSYNKNEAGIVTSITPQTFELISVNNPYKEQSANLVRPEEGIVYGVSGKYRLTESAGSNYQHPNGFMFDTLSFKRPSYSKVSEYIKDETRGLTDVSFEIKNIGVNSFLDNKIKAEEAGFELEIEGGEVYAYTDRGRVLVNDLVDSDFNETAEPSEVEEIVESNEDMYDDEVDESAAQSFSVADIFGSVEKTVEEQNPVLTEWWDENIQNNPENLSKLVAEQQIASLEQLLEQRNDPDQNYESDEEFIDQLKSCIL